MNYKLFVMKGVHLKTQQYRSKRKRLGIKIETKIEDMKIYGA